jgi:hypothetical protein
MVGAVLYNNFISLSMVPMGNTIPKLVDSDLHDRYLRLIGREGKLTIYTIESGLLTGSAEWIGSAIWTGISYLTALSVQRSGQIEEIK